MNDKCRETRTLDTPEVRLGTDICRRITRHNSLDNRWTDIVENDTLGIADVFEVILLYLYCIQCINSMYYPLTFDNKNVVNIKVVCAMFKLAYNSFLFTITWVYQIHDFVVMRNHNTRASQIDNSKNTSQGR